MTLMTAAICSTVAKYVRRSDVTLGLRVSRRTEPGLLEMLGTFSEDVAFRIACGAADDPREWVEVVKTNLHTILEHPFYPYEDLNASLQRSQPTPNAELFSIMVNYLPAGVMSHEYWGVKFVPLVGHMNTKYYVNVRVVEADRYELDVKYRRDKHDEATIQLFVEDVLSTARHLVALLS